jgi:hypothetical protein
MKIRISAGELALLIECIRRDGLSEVREIARRLENERDALRVERDQLIALAEDMRSSLLTKPHIKEAGHPKQKVHDVPEELNPAMRPLPRCRAGAPGLGSCDLEEGHPGKHLWSLVDHA